jgi:peptidoglycan/LPS O-acetylase OafA/YrhL
VYPLVRLEPRMPQAMAGAFGPVARAGIALGLCSYSLYLLHAPILGLGNLITQQLAPGAGRSLLTASWLAVVLLAAWLHYKWVELPFLRLGARGAKPKPAA